MASTSKTEWSYITPIAWDSYLQMILFGPLGIFLLQYPLSLSRLLGVLFILVALMPLWRRGFLINSNSVLQWSGPGRPFFKKNLPAKEFATVNLQTNGTKRKEKNDVRLSLEQVSLRGQNDTLRVAEGGRLRYDYLVGKAVELARFLNVPLCIDDEIIPVEHLQQDIRERLAQTPREAPTLPEAFELERQDGTTIITKPGLGKRVFREYWFLTLLVLISFVSIFVGPQLWLDDVQQPWFTLLCLLGVALFVFVLATFSRTQRLTLDNQGILVEHFGGGIPVERAQMDQGDVSHLCYGMHQQADCLHFFGTSGRMSFGLNSKLDPEAWSQLQEFIEYELSQRQVSPPSLPSKLGIPGLAEAILIAAGITALVLGHLAFTEPYPLPTVEKWAVSDDGTAYYYDSTEDDRVLVFEPDSTTAEIIHTEPLRAYGFDVSGDGKHFVLRRLDESGRYHTARYEPETREFLTVSREDEDNPWMANISRDGKTISYIHNEGLSVFHEEDQGAQHMLEVEEFNIHDRGSLSSDGRSYATTSIDNDSISVLNTHDETQVKVEILPAHAENSILTPRLSGNGKSLAYTSQSRPEGETSVIVLAHLETGQSEILSMGLNGLRANDVSYRPSLDHSGQLVAFTSDASNLVKDDDNRGSDVFLFRDSTSSLEKLSQGQGDFDDAQVSGDGRFVFFGGSHMSYLLRYSVATGELEDLVLPPR